MRNLIIRVSFRHVLFTMKYGLHNSYFSAFDTSAICLHFPVRTVHYGGQGSGLMSYPSLTLKPRTTSELKSHCRTHLSSRHRMSLTFRVYICKCLTVRAHSLANLLCLGAFGTEPVDMKSDNRYR